MTHDPESRTLQVHRHTTVHYRVAGDGPRPVVLVHGFGASSHSWDNLMDRLPPDRVTCYAVDLKGFGKSSKHPDDRYGIDAQAQAVEAVMRHEGLADVVMVGNSMGGGVVLYEAVRDARRDDKLLAGIVLLGPACYPQALP
ncbi:MAG: alpha/beta fold hydrolase, partial [Planctomycetota bacterium]